MSSTPICPCPAQQLQAYGLLLSGHHLLRLWMMVAGKAMKCVLPWKRAPGGEPQSHTSMHMDPSTPYTHLCPPT